MIEDPAGYGGGDFAVMESDKASIRNVVIDFLLGEHYLLSAFELYHEMLEDGQTAAAVKLHTFFADADMFPPEQMRALQSIDAQLLADEREAASERAAVTEYELRLAREDITSLHEKLESFRQAERATVKEDALVTSNEEPAVEGSVLTTKRSFRDLRPIGDMEKGDLNCAVKEYLVSAGYKLTAMTLYEEADQDLDDRPNQVPDALRRYYLSFLSSSVDAVEERSALQAENASLLKDKASLEIQISSSTKSVETARRDAKEKDRQLSQLKASLSFSEKQLNEFRSEVTSLKLELESVKFNRDGHAPHPIEPLPVAEDSLTDANVSTIKSDSTPNPTLERAAPSLSATVSRSSSLKDHLSSVSSPANGDTTVIEEEGLKSMLTPEELNVHGSPRETHEQHQYEIHTVQILAEALPRIVPYVLINYREELLPLIICAIERHPEDSVRHSLTKTLFNLIKKPDEQQRRVIMDACVSLARNVGEVRTENELLSQCWLQIDDKYEERRILVAQSCGELGQFVRAEMRPSLILSIIQQLMEDDVGIVREAAAQNLALLLPFFPDLDKFFKVEEMMFQLICDPAGIVVETSLRQLLPAVVAWGRYEKQLISHLLSALLSRLSGSLQRCPTVSAEQDSFEFQLRILGDRERWVADVLLRTLIAILPEVRRVAMASCPFPDIFFEDEEDMEAFFSEELLKLYSRSNVEWPDFDWLPEDCFPVLLHLAGMLPAREEGLRTRLTLVLRNVSKLFGGHYLKSIVLPIFLMASGDFADTSHLSSRLANRIKGFKPLTPKAEQLARICVLPLLLAGVFGAPNMGEGHLAKYLREFVLQYTVNHGPWTTVHTPELIDAVRFLCTFKEHLDVIVGVLWDLVVSPNSSAKATAAVLFKISVPYADLKLATQQVLPALVTLGSDTNLDVRYASIEAFGTVAQHFQEDAVVDKIRVQMDAFLDDDGSHEATIAVVRALATAVPLTTPSLRDYLMQKLVVLSGATSQNTNLVRRREKVDAFCEAIRALDATDISANSVKDFLLPTIQNLLKDMDALDPAHKEALEVIVQDRAGGLRLDLLSKHLRKSSMGGLFGEGGYLGTPISTNLPPTIPLIPETPIPQSAPVQPAEGRFKFFRNFRGTPSDT